MGLSFSLWKHLHLGISASLNVLPGDLRTVYAGPWRNILHAKIRQRPGSKNKNVWERLALPHVKVDIGFDYRVIAGQIMVRITIKAIKSTNRVMSDRKNPTRPITPLLRARRVTIPIETPLDTSLRAVSVSYTHLTLPTNREV